MRDIRAEWAELSTEPGDPDEEGTAGNGGER